MEGSQGTHKFKFFWPRGSYFGPVIIRRQLCENYEATPKYVHVSASHIVHSQEGLRNWMSHSLKQKR